MSCPSRLPAHLLLRAVLITSLWGPDQTMTASTTPSERLTRETVSQSNPVQPSSTPHRTRGCSERNLGTRTGPAKPALRSPSRRTLLASQGVATTPRLTHGHCCAAFLGFRCSRAGSRAFAHPSFRYCSHYRTRRRCPRLPPSPLDTHMHTVSSTAERPHRHTLCRRQACNTPNAVTSNWEQSDDPFVTDVTIHITKSQ